MSHASPQLLEVLLQQCAMAAPAPWYPAAYSQATATPRELLDPYLDQLRMAGLLHLTDWVQGQGQGYALTEAGTQILANPRQLNRLRAGELPVDAPHAQALEDFGELMPSSWVRGEAARRALTESAPSIATTSLILVNLAWFVAGLVLAIRDNIPAVDYLFKTDGRIILILHRIGALQGADVYLHNEWWRLLTCCFVHIGFIHLAVNMYSLYVVGPLLERLWGSWRFLLLYLIAGFGGSCGMLIDEPVGLGAGASGAIWGVLASLAAWLFLHRAVLPSQLIAHMRRRLLTIFLLNIFITFGVPNISKGAHFGGGVVGLITAVPVDVMRYGRGRQRLAAVVALVAIPVICLAAAVKSLERAAPEIKQWEALRNVREFRVLFIARLLGLLRETQAILKEEALPILKQVPQQRDPGAVQKVLAVLSDKRLKLTQLQQQLDKNLVGPGQQLDGISQEIAIIALVLELADTRLRSGQKWTEQDAAQLDQFLQS